MHILNANAIDVHFVQCAIRILNINSVHIPSKLCILIRLTQRATGALDPQTN